MRPAVTRRRVRVRGVVQGVGFRPFVYALAARLALTGEVGNDVDGVFAEVQGAPADVEAFCHAVRRDAPPLSVVESVEWTELSPRSDGGFTIVASGPAGAGSGRRTLVPADVATCGDCLAEFADPADRRYRHPFITCTNCGPRFTIVTGLPYDRPMTTMRDFPMCPDCAREYADPGDRRFHAQPISCHACGPVLELVEPGRAAVSREEALTRARELLADGRTVAVKGIGGYHLACDATNPGAVARLRERKRRGDKPFAVLVPDLETARAVAEVDDVAAGLLTSARRPIVLLPSCGEGGPVAEAVAPRVGRLGIMLPPTALHHLLVAPGAPRILVLTSGNLAGEPIVTDDAEALDRLSALAEAWLRHDRTIHVPCDDSVVTVADGVEVPIRRSRGYAPMPVALPFEVEPTLAVGGDLKNTFCLAQGRYAWLSAHLGDMDDLATQTAVDHAVEHLAALVEVTPRRLVADAHPAYRSTAWARRTAAARGLDPPSGVQHHHAHLASVMAEHRLDGAAPVLGIAFDGTGYGEDGAVWGGEVLLADYRSATRLAHLGYAPLPGGDSAVHRPYRMALAHLWAAGIDWTTVDPGSIPALAACPPTERRVLARQLQTGLGCVPTSSMGRLFDAVASLAGICHQVGYEAQAAMELQALAERAEADEPAGASPVAPPFPLPLRTPADGGPWTWDVAELIRAVLTEVQADPALGGSGGPSVSVQERIALRLHRAIAAAVVTVAERAAESGRWHDPDRRVALTGGVFANVLLLRSTTKALQDKGYQVIRSVAVPANDAGLALGQTVIAASADRTSTGRSG